MVAVQPGENVLGGEGKIALAGKKVIFLFPGQGAQYPGMGLDLAEGSAAARDVFDRAGEALGSSLGRDLISLIRDSDAETLKRTDLSQPALSAASLAAAACLGERGVVPAACAGFSLGEYPALACAGVISLENCFRLTAARGRVMRAAADRLAAAGTGAPGMAAVLGLAPERVESLIAQWKAGGLKDLYAANINSPRQVVVSGTAAALAEAEKRFKEAGARRMPRLQVTGPFHSPLMAEAADEFAAVLETVEFKDPAIPLFSNVTGKQLRSGAEAKALAPRQMVEPVRWTDEESALAELKPAALVETGPGGVLRGLWKDTGSDIPCYAAGTAAEIDALTYLPG
ncbi:MAG: ACP S-malonyltransferase [Treponema sp.]|jgi:[acyl-carrier-protein] S-malonyltransferase|nr:ACP S-malonyltransferase [Treponema sp.]